MQWQVQEAKQRFSELLRRAHDEGPQAVTRHGEEVAMVVDIAWYREVTGAKKDFAVFLSEMPHADGLAEELDRNRAMAAGDRGRHLWFDEDDIAEVEA
jgi:prevent-host-death family protein